MNYGNCALCGRLVAYNTVRICDDCKEKKLELVINYLKENGVTKTDELCAKLNIPKRLIVDFIVEGSLEMKFLNADEVDQLLEEERKRNVVSTINSLVANQSKIETQKQELKSSGNKMRFLNRNRK